jgi:putative ABC transport system permease protein
MVGDNGWWVIFAPPGDEKRRDLGQTLGGAVGLESTSDPSVKPDPHGVG